MQMLDSDLLRFLNNEGITAQMVIDRAQSRFDPVWYPRLFRVLPPTLGLDFTTIIGRTRVEAMATVMDRESEFVMRGRPGVEKIRGEVPAIGVAYPMDVNTFREVMQVLDNKRLTEDQRVNAIIDYVFNDYLKAGNAVNKRVDAFCIQAVSEAVINVDLANNPDGIAFNVPLLLDPTHRLNPVKAWTDTTADIVFDIEQAVQDAGDNLHTIDRIMVSRALWRTMSRNQSIIDYVKTYNNPGSNNKYNATRDAFNEALLANQLPPVEIVDEKTAVSKDGYYTPFRAWNQTNAVFVPAGQLGVIHNAFADDQLMPVENVTYSNFGNILMSRWRQRKPNTEYTAAEWNAFPGLEAIDSIYIMDTETPKG